MSGAEGEKERHSLQREQPEHGSQGKTQQSVRGTTGSFSSWVGTPFLPLQKEPLGS